MPKSTAALVAIAVLLAPAAMLRAQAYEDHAHFSAGEPGDAKKKQGPYAC
jgi:hypothetical protein